MSPLKRDDYPSSGAFDDIKSYLSSLSPEKRAAAAKQANGVFVFTLRNKQDQLASWHVDMKNSKGSVGQGKPEGAKGGVVELILSDEDFGRLVAGSANAQKLFMSGKLKIRGDAMKATKIEPILKQVQGRTAKL